MLCYAATDEAFDFMVNVKDIPVGDGALEENIRKVFDIEGVEDRATGSFSADAVEVNAAAAEGGKVKFTVTPKVAWLGGNELFMGGPLNLCNDRR